MRDVRRHGEWGGGAFSWANAEENLRHANTDAASEKESRRGEKEIADTNPNSENDSITNRYRQEKNERVADFVAAPKEETFTNRKSGRNLISIAKSESECFATSQEKSFADSGSIWISIGDTGWVAVTISIAFRIAKTRRAERDFVAQSDQGIRELSAEGTEASHFSARTDHPQPGLQIWFGRSR